MSKISNNIRQRGAMIKFISDKDQAEISNKAKELLRDLFIDYYQSEARSQFKTQPNDGIKPLKDSQKLSSIAQETLRITGFLR